MSDLLLSGAPLQCMHQFPIGLTGSHALTVGGTSVVTDADLAAADLTKCIPPGSPPPPKCTLLSAAAESVALTAGGVAVVLVSSALKTDQGPVTVAPAPPAAAGAA